VELTLTIRPNFLPNERFLELRSILRDHLQRIGATITPETFPGICDDLIWWLLKDSFRRAGADEGSVWIVDSDLKHLVIAYNSGPKAGEMIGFRQSLQEGIVSLVFANEQSFVETEVYRNAQHSGKLDQKLSVTTYAMIVVPFYFLNECRGVISCVKLMEATTSAGKLLPKGPVPGDFDLNDLSTIQNVALIIRDLIDYRLLKTTVAWKQG
jgi:hypothetical protein